MANTSSKKAPVMSRPGKFLKETWVELKKASWPSRDELKKSTLLVLAALIIVTVWIGGLDSILSLITKLAGLT